MKKPPTGDPGDDLTRILYCVNCYLFSHCWVNIYSQYSKGMDMFETIKQKNRTGPVPRRTDLETTLCEAIRSKTRIRLHYKNEGHFRTFEPYIIYESAGRILVAGVQIKDDPRTLSTSGWREFEVDRVNTILRIRETFRPDPEFSPFRAKFGTNVICDVDRI